MVSNKTKSVTAEALQKVIKGNFNSLGTIRQVSKTEMLLESILIFSLTFELLIRKLNNLLKHKHGSFAHHIIHFLSHLLYNFFIGMVH